MRRWLKTFSWIDDLNKKREKESIQILSKMLEKQKYLFISEKLKRHFRIVKDLGFVQPSTVKIEPIFESNTISALCNQRIDKINSLLHTAIESNKGKIIF